jgi:hypothetical protein
MKTTFASILALAFSVIMLAASLPVRDAEAQGCTSNQPCPPNTTSSVVGMSCIEGCCGAPMEMKYCLQISYECRYSNDNTTNAWSQGCYVPGFSTQTRLCRCGYQDDEL